jgi:nucleotide-binding universal stress UspA family protein
MAVAVQSTRAHARAPAYRRLLVPVVDNAVSLRAVEVACRLAADRHASLEVLSVIEVPPLLPLEAHMLDEEVAAHRLLERAEAIADLHGVPVSVRLVRARDAGSAIAELVDGSTAELVVLGAERRARGGLGSTVRYVLAKSRCRVMLLSATSPAERGT